MFGASVLGRPGRNPGRLRFKRSVLGWLLPALALVGAYGAVLVGLPLAAVLVGLAGHLVGRHYRASARRAAVGRGVERLVAARLRRLGAEVVVFGYRPRGRRADIDAIVLGPWLAAVEIKHGEGRVRVRRDGRVQVGGRRLPGYPLRQATAGAAAVRRAIGTADQVEAILCIAGMRGRSRIIVAQGTTIRLTSARRLVRTIRRLPRSLAPGEGRRIADGLRAGRPGRNPSPYRPGPV